MPPYIDYEILFTQKEIKDGISVLQEYLDKKAIQEQKEKEEEFAVVVAVSDLDEVKINDKYYKMPLKVGDKVMYKKYSGTDIKDGDEDLILIKAEDILAIVE